jgi:hypothetical protein
MSYSWHGASGGVDYNAVVGAIAYNSASSTGGQSICGSGVSLIPSVYDTKPGTHIYIAGYFGYHNINSFGGGGCNTDGEGLILDSWGNINYSARAVVEQSAVWGNGSAGFEIFPQGDRLTNDRSTIVISNNTSYGNYQDPKNPGGGELFLNQVYPRAGVGGYTIENNIFVATLAHPGVVGKGTVVGAEVDCLNQCPNPPVSISGNYIWNAARPITTEHGGKNTHAWYGGADQGSTWIWGTNVYDDPGFINPGALPTSALHCEGYVTTTACMIARGVVGNLRPSGGAVGKGYQPPGECAENLYYPRWLKGIIYLLWTGSALTQNAGLITKPCDM